MKVLLVEDEKDLCDLLKEELEQAGFEVDAAYLGTAALSLYHRKRYDVVVLDLRLPDIPGISVLSSIRQLQEEPPPRVIVFTGLDDRELRIHAQMLDVEDYIIKPFKPEYLAARIRALSHRIERLVEVPQSVLRE